MFTGLVLGTGTVISMNKLGKEAHLTIRPNFLVSEWSQGESIAVNGACLSVETYTTNSFTAYASQETLQKTNLGRLTVGSTVNLERALALGDRLGGHLVSGHVDDLATVASITPAGSSKIYRIHFPSSFSAHVIPKGSVTLDGISLTINTCGDDFLEVNVIPDTQTTTTITQWKVGTQVNFETDLIGKYVQQNMVGYLQKVTGTTAANTASPNITMDFLRENGF